MQEANNGCLEVQEETVGTSLEVQDASSGHQEVQKAKSGCL